MKIELIPEQLYTARAGEQVVHCLRIESEWEGLRKLTDIAGRHVILSADGAVVSGSPALLHDLRLTTAADHFVTVPETLLPTGQVVPAFQVAQYACSSQDGALVVSASGKPVVNISYREAKKQCAAAGLKMITELQYLAIAVNIASVAVNWTGGEVGNGALYQGIHKGNVNGPQGGSYESPDTSERRWHELSNGARVYDFAGNVFTWVHDDVQGDAEGLVKESIAKDSPSLSCSPAKSKQKGVGYIPDGPLHWSGIALVRGGYWFSVGYAGVFSLDHGGPDYAGGYVGVRCTK